MNIIKPIISFYEKLMAKYPLLFDLYAIQYRKVLNREIKLANINSNDIVLNIGCGAMPFTAIYIAKKTSAFIIAIDKDPDAVAKAKILIKHYGLQEKISVILCNGQNTEQLPQYTKAIVALQANPKDLVLKNLLKTAKTGTSLLFRHPRKYFKKEYGTLDNFHHDSFVRHWMPTFDKTLLYKKKGI